MVISLSLDVSEASSAQPVQLETQRSTFLVGDNVNIGFLADANLITKMRDGSPVCQDFQSQIVIASVCQAVTIV